MSQVKNVIKISVIIPTFNASESLLRTIKSVKFAADEVIVVDGGSTDGSVQIAKEAGAKVVKTGRGRGLQLSIGAREAINDHLLFLHADTQLGPNWPEMAINLLLGGQKAGVFKFVLEDQSFFARLVEVFVSLRCRSLGWAWGDQGLLIDRTLYLAVGGFNPALPLFEDVDIIRRIGKPRLEILNENAITSATRYLRGGYFCRSLINLCCLISYFLGVSPERILRFYN